MALAHMTAVVGVASMDFLGGPAWDTVSERVSQGIETWGLGYTI